MVGCLLLLSLSAVAADPPPPGVTLRLGDTRFRTGGEVVRLWFSDDGRELLSRSDVPALNGKAVVVAWDAATGRVLRRSEVPRPGGKPDPRLTLPGGRPLAVGGDGVAVVTDGPGGKVVARLAGHPGVTAAALSPDGTRLATGSAAGLVRVWDADTLRPLTEPAGHTDEVTGIDLTPDGKRAVTTGFDGAVRVWDVAAGRELRAFRFYLAREPRVHRGDPAPKAVFAPGGTAVVFRSPAGLEARDVLTGLEVPLPPPLRGSAPRRVAFSPDGTALYTDGTRDGEAVWDWPAGTKRFDVSPDGGVGRATFSADGRVLFTEGRELYRWDAAAGRRLGPVELDDTRDCRLLGASPDGRRVLAQSYTGLLRVFDVRAGRPAADTVVPGAWGGRRAGFAAALPGWRTGVAAAGVGGEVILYETATGRPRRRLAHPPRADGRPTTLLGVTPDGSQLMTAGPDHTVLVWGVRLQDVPLPAALRRETDAGKLWDRLAGDDAEAAYLAMARLAADPEAAVAMARRKVKPAKPVPDAVIERAFGNLGSDAFAVREAASRELAGYGEPAAAGVRARLAGGASAEVRRRAEAFLASATGDGPAAAAGRVRVVRAVELLEAVGTPDAKAWLKELAAGDPAAWVTREAAAAVERVGVLRWRGDAGV